MIAGKVLLLDGVLFLTVLVVLLILIQLSAKAIVAGPHGWIYSTSECDEVGCYKIGCMGTSLFLLG